MVSAPELIVKKTTEVRYVVMDFAAQMDTGETITGTPTVAYDPSTGAPTTASITVIGQTVQFKLGAGTAGIYTAIVTIVTSAGETLVGQGRLEVY